MIDLYIIRPTVIRSFNVETIKQRRNSNIDSNDNFFFHPYGVIIDEWEELETISFLKLITYFFFF